ncbi:hypothetical protein HZA33_03790 [Candidatus Pacearchaeota archaeon]|nr:hypothetical protein [Candidatus Pacearchaeota archaeon]
MNLKKAFGIGAIVLALASGCANKTKTANIEGISELQGRVTEVKQKTLTYLWEAFPTEKAKFIDPYHATAECTFEYVYVKGRDGKSYTLICPYKKSIAKGNARIKYEPVAFGKIDAGTLISQYIHQDGYTKDDNFIIEADGIITKDGIK